MGSSGEGGGLLGAVGTVWEQIPLSFFLSYLSSNQPESKRADPQVINAGATTWSQVYARCISLYDISHTSTAGADPCDKM